MKITRDELDLLLDVAMARIECGVSPLAGMRPGSIGYMVGEVANELHAKGVTRRQTQEAEVKELEGKHA